MQGSCRLLFSDLQSAVVISAVVTDNISDDTFKELPTLGHANFLTPADQAHNEKQFNRCFVCTSAAAGPRLTSPLIQRAHS